MGVKLLNRPINPLEPEGLHHYFIMTAERAHVSNGPLETRTRPIKQTNQ